ARMFSSDEVVNPPRHRLGGACPFGLEHPLPVYCAISLKGYNEVLPAAGATHCAVRITPERMAELTSATWVDVCQ
ncbi:YbaK/EbsC family protein, partial [Salmonella enterica]|uniref:YbaK/EbsC family protein n=1 Tax=Salmonella enterica TaxID=28901 RepID=UPI00329693DE